MYNRPVGDRRPRRKVRHARNTRIKKVRYARITRIQHDKLLPETGGRKGGVPPGLHARVQGDYIKIESSMISPSHWSRCQRRQERGVSTVSQSDSEPEKHRSQQSADSATDIAMETIEGSSDNAQDWELIALEDSNEDRHPPPQGGPISMSMIDGKAGWDRPKIVD